MNLLQVLAINLKLWRFHPRLFFLISGGFSVLLGCSPLIQDDLPPPRLRVAVLPDQKPEVLRERNQSLLRYLAKELAVPTELVIPQSYEEVVDIFVKKEADLCWLGGFTYVLASRSGNALPLVMRDGDQHFTSVFVARAQDSRRTLAEFNHGRIAFSTKFSTSGYLMPLQHLRQLGFEPGRNFAEEIYSGSHDRTVELVCDGRADLGAVNPHIWRDMCLRAQVKPSELIQVAETDPFVDYVWAVHRSMPYNFRTRLEAAFLNLNRDNPTANTVLKDQAAQVYLPCEDGDFDDIRGAVAAYEGKKG